MEDVYYLIHTTNDPECLNWTELRTSKFNMNHQFPGIYFSVITKDNIDTERIYSGKYILIFSKNLLLQKNYHINLVDYNGIITEKNTYYPWMLNNFILEIKNLCVAKKVTMNEIIFHDNINMKHCCSINIRNGIDDDYLLPKIQFENNELPDMTKIPFYCFPFEHIYTGCNPLPKSSIEWYNVMSKLTDTTDTTDTTDIINKIKKNAEYLYHNRNKQNIGVLIDFINSKNKN